jgi:hypothetical protein
MLRLARRVAGYLLAFIAACSALVCVGSAVLWVRGYFVGDEFRYIQSKGPEAGNTTTGASTSDTDWVVASSRGRLGLAATSRVNVSRPPPKRPLIWRRDRPPVPIALASPTPWGRLGFQFVSDAVPLGTNAFIVVIGIIMPSWFLVGFSAVPPGLAYLVWRRRRRTQLRRERGQCVRCGYDLRGTPERCPECGAVSTPATVHA